MTEHSPSELFFSGLILLQSGGHCTLSLKYFFCVEGKPCSRQAVNLGNFLEEEDGEKKEKKNPMPFESEDGDQP